jgi:hypothetical protein
MSGRFAERASPDAAGSASAGPRAVRRSAASGSRLRLFGDRLRLTELRFASATIGICLVLQRFILPLGDPGISVAVPLVFGLAGLGLINGCLAFERRRLGFYMALCAVGLVSMIVQINLPLSIAPRQSIQSLIYWLAITGFAAFQFGRAVDEAEFMRVVNRWLGFLAIAGILQFLAQFVGLAIFSFTDYVPDNLLIENQYAVVIPMESGFTRANGFFLVEPSVFSQFMAVGLIVEWLYFQRPQQFGLFLAGLLAAVSGTGWMILGAFVVQVAIITGGRGLLQAILAIGVGVGVLVAVSFGAPEVADAFLNRFYEFWLPGTSGYERFVSPFLVMGDVFRERSWAFITGIGPGATGALTITYVYNLFTVAKVLLEYGIFGLIFYLALVLTGHRTRRQRLMLLPLMVFLMFTGGYHQFPPILFFVILVGTVATLKQEAALTD